MTEHAITPDQARAMYGTAAVEALNIRRWQAKVWNPASPSAEGYMTREEEKARATAILRDVIRDEGFVLDGESVTCTQCDLALVIDGVPFEHFDPDDANGSINTWTATAHERGTDTGDLLPDSTDDEGRAWFTVPDAVKADGGEVRLRHLFDCETVTCYAYDDTDHAEKMGYLIAVEIDRDVVSIALLPGTAAVSVQADPDPEDEE